MKRYKNEFNYVRGAVKNAYVLQTMWKYFTPNITHNANFIKAHYLVTPLFRSLSWNFSLTLGSIKVEWM